MSKIKHVEPRPFKESRTCFSCGTTKTKSQFFDLYQHPALTFLGNNLVGIICTNCAKKEMGKRIWKQYSEKE